MVEGLLGRGESFLVAAGGQICIRKHTPEHLVNGPLVCSFQHLQTFENGLDAFVELAGLYQNAAKTHQAGAQP
jgi:hypothetical protein